MQNTLHDRLLELPLFQGMSRNDLRQVIDDIKFRSISYLKGKTIVSENEPCDRLFFLVNGVISTTCHADDNGYAITETFSAPDILQPERIFGLTQRYTRTFKSVTDTAFICITKQDVLALSDRYEIFRLNLLNIVCTQSQRLARIPWHTIPIDIRHKIARFIHIRCLRPAGTKTVKIKMERLAHEISESRLNVSQELNAMKREGIITLRRGEIHIEALERLIM